MQRGILALILTAMLITASVAIDSIPKADGRNIDATQTTLPGSSDSFDATARHTRNSRPTSTTRPKKPTSTTTTPPAETTTTAAATTTSSTTKPAPNPPGPSGLTIPATKAYSGDIESKGGYVISATNLDTGVNWWNAPYLGTNLPYTSGAKWIDGDREGYGCAYGFIEDPSGEIDGRFTFVRPPDATYAQVNDKWMDEGQRFYDGTLVEPSQGSEITTESCSGESLSNVDYDTACNGVVDNRPRIGFFDEKGQILDIRDYSNTKANNVIFSLFSFNGSRATVIACEDGVVGMVVYYDTLGDGQMGVDFNGVGPYQP